MVIEVLSHYEFKIKTTDKSDSTHEASGGWDESAISKIQEGKYIWSSPSGACANDFHSLSQVFV